MQSGELTVTGKDSTRILLANRPREVIVRFEHEPEHVPCNHHHHHDKISYRIIGEDEDAREHHKLGHHHHDRQFYLFIEWEVDGVRDIRWIVFG